VFVVPDSGNTVAVAFLLFLDLSGFDMLDKAYCCTRYSVAICLIYQDQSLDVSRELISYASHNFPRLRIIMVRSLLDDN